MKTQNFLNHSTINYPTRTFNLFVVLAMLIFLATFANLLYALYSQGGRVNALFFHLLSWLFIVSYFLFRSFALKAQDRAIRAEENLRHFVLTGKLLDAKLTIGQIVALRFAPDEEFIELVKKAAEENLSNKQIKQLIKSWKADYHRA